MSAETLKKKDTRKRKLSGSREDENVKQKVYKDDPTSKSPTKTTKSDAAQGSSTPKVEVKGDKKEDFEFFFGMDSPFSQFHPASFTINDIHYSCAEQFMMHSKAVTFKDKEMAAEIMKATKPLVMKKCGRKVSNFDPKIWGKKSLEFVKQGNIAKFSQNETLKQKLFGTHPRILVEASPRDRLWGIGLGKNNPKAWNKSTWRGKNQLGYILTEVREELMKKEKK